MSQLFANSRRRIALFTALVVLVGLTVSAGSAAAHNPACEQTAGPNGPHYDDDPRTGSETAYEKNPTLGGDFDEAAVDSCTAGNGNSNDGH
jgi:hypothetical protein